MRNHLFFKFFLVCTTFTIMHEQEKGTQWHGFSNQTLNVFVNYATICKRGQRLDYRSAQIHIKLNSKCQYNTHKQRFYSLSHRFTERVGIKWVLFPLRQTQILNVSKKKTYIGYKDNIMHLLHIHVNSVSWLCVTMDHISNTILRTKSPQLLTTIQS
jgi:hypothetical protein